MNLLGVGTDIECIDRFEKLVTDNNETFFQKIFTQNELDFCFGKKNPAPHLAARFAGKESVVKALSRFEISNIDYKDIEILHSNNNAPKVKLLNNKHKKIQIEISLSHCKDKAIAFVIARETPS